MSDTGGQSTSDAELTRLRAEAELAEAEAKLARAKAALAAAEASRAAEGDAPARADDLAAADAASIPEPASAAPVEPAAVSPSTPADAAAGTAPPAAQEGSLSRTAVDAVRAAYAFEGPALELGALVNPNPMPDVPVRIPLAMTNRHGLVSGATGTGKTRTLQLLAEQFAEAGVPVFAADVKGDLSGVSVAGQPSDKLLARTTALGQDWSGSAVPTEFLALGGIGHGVPVRATVTGFGPLLLSKVLGLNQTQESSLSLVFHYADQAGLALVDLADLRAVLTYLTSDEGKPELKELGGLSSATAGVILRELITFAESGADVFFGEPEFQVPDLLRLATDGRGVVSLLEVPGVADRPVLYSTFLMYLLAELFEMLPEVGDAAKPKVVFFFDEAHLLFNGASKAFLAAITQTVRLIRSKGVALFFVTQSPKDVPADVLAQLGSRVQHALRAFTPDDAKALRAAVGTFPRSEYDLERVLQELGTGEAIVTVMNEDGVPTPVAWTRLRAPRGSMSPVSADAMDAAIAASALLPKYRDAVDPESAREILAARMAKADEAHAAEVAAAAQAKTDAEFAKQQAALEKAQAKADRAAQAEYDRTMRQTSSRTRTAKQQKSPLEQLLGSRSTQTIINGVIRGIFGNGRR